MQHTTPSRTRQVRRSDIEPYSALRWTNEVFKGVAGFLLLVMVVRFIYGVSQYGLPALPALAIDAARLFVLAVALWGAGDLGRLLLDVGHDIRTERLLLTRLVSRTPERPEDAPHGDVPEHRRASDPEAASEPTG
ncbi:MAG TPA: hypothetical protein VFQ38_07535 [Longimicrobiales bacterium]|nr:hypothetical protein [Longimicrobiales bacterium]